MKGFEFQGNGLIIFQIKKQLSNLCQVSLDVGSYYTQLKILWNELIEFQLVSICHCGGLKIWIDDQHRKYVTQFLMGLNESCSFIRAQFLMLYHLPPISKGFSLVIQVQILLCPILN